MIAYPSYKVAAAHVAPVFHDAERSVAKACSIIAEASRKGVRLIAFPEAFIPGFPIWAGVVAPTLTHDFFRALAASSIRIDGPELAQIRNAARQHQILVSMGFTEGTPVSVGCLWNSNVLIGDDGSILNHHRKLVPTFYEKLVWASGDGEGLRVSETALGRLGMLICGENTNPLARYTLMAQGEQVHISSYPPVYPTRPLGSDGNYDLKQAILIRAGAHSFEAKVFNIVASAAYDDPMRRAVESLGRDAIKLLDESPKAVSMVLNPNGLPVSEFFCEDEGLAIAEINLADAIEQKRIHDVVGYYNRFDIFRLNVDRTANRPVSFQDDIADLPVAEATSRRSTGPTIEAPENSIAYQRRIAANGEEAIAG